MTRGPPQRDGAELGKTIPTGGPHLSVREGVLDIAILEIAILDIDRIFLVT